MTLPFHPLAEVFPPLEGMDFDELVASIRLSGQHEPITTYEDKILDGRNRARACASAGVPPIYFPLPEGADPVMFVIEKNLHRRHLTPSQRAFIAQDLVTRRRGDNQHTSAEGPSIKEAAKLLGVGHASVERAKVVAAKAAPEIQDAVRTGEVTVTTAAEIAKKPQAEQRQALEKHKDSVKRSRKRKRAAPSRPQRWAKACSFAEDALQLLIDLQAEYQEWRDNLPENLINSGAGEKLDMICDLDLQSAFDTVSEAANCDLPRGFGKD